MTCVKQKDRLAAVSPKFDWVYFDQAAIACAFFFLRQPSRPNAPRPVVNSGKAAGSGVSDDTTRLSNAGFGTAFQVAEKSTLINEVNDRRLKVAQVSEKLEGLSYSPTTK